VRDVVATGIYVVMVALNLYLFSKWQKRGLVDETAATDTPKVSRFGRPLRRAKKTDAPVEGAAPDALEPEPAGASTAGPSTTGPSPAGAV
jgi:hypothetical protein